MRLFLSSYKFGNQPEKLVELVGSNKRVAVIGNAKDYVTPAERAEKMAEEFADLKALGFDPFEIDLRNYFEKPLTTDDLQGAGMIWVRGGNVFVLRLAMKLSGFDEVLKQGLKVDAFVYGGFSAGGCVLSPSLEAFDIVDDPTMTEIAYNLVADYSALEIIEYHFEPHYKSDHPESADVDKEVALLREKGLPYKTLRDGEAVVIKDGVEELLR